MPRIDIDRDCDVVVPSTPWITASQVDLSFDMRPSLPSSPTPLPDSRSLHCFLSSGRLGMSAIISKRQTSNELAPSREAVLKVFVYAIEPDVNIIHI